MMKFRMCKVAFLALSALLFASSAMAAGFVGIGITIQEKNKKILIAEVRDNAPAYKAGVRPGEWLLAVDGKKTDGNKLDEVSSWLSGQVGTPVVLTLQDPKTQAVSDVSVVREYIEVKCWIEGWVNLTFNGRLQNGYLSGQLSGYINNVPVYWNVMNNFVSGYYQGQYVNLNINALNQYSMTISGWLHRSYVSWMSNGNWFSTMQPCIE